MGYVSREVANGRFISITVSVEGQKEIDAYRSMLKSDIPKCPHCGEPLNPTVSNMMLKLSSPLQSIFGMELGSIVTVCQKCNTRIESEITVDLEGAFPSAIAFMKELRKQYKAKQNAAKGGAPRG